MVNSTPGIRQTLLPAVKFLRWIDRHIIDLARQVRLSYLPPLLVYLAAGISGLTGIVGTFFVKDYLGLSAEFLAMLGFWAGLPWALKMPMGHLVDLFWRWKFIQEIVFAGSMAIVLFLMTRLLKELSPRARRTLVGTAVVIFVFRALPGPGAGATWWQIDALGFDQQFISLLSLIGGGLALLGMVIFRRFMAERSIAYVVGFLTIVGFVLSLPVIGMYYGIHEWTATLTNGVVDARFIAIVDTALESPLGQVAMIPMLAWIANSAPPHLKATFFAVMASFTNLALSLSSLCTKYLNKLFTVGREILDPMTGQITVPADYSELGTLLITVTCLALLLPMLTILLVNRTPSRKLSFVRN